MNKEKKRRIIDTVMYFSVAAVFLTAISLLVLAITSIPDDEMLEVCWQSNGMAQYTNGMEAEEQTCTEPQPVVWHSDLLTVAVTDDGRLLTLEEARRAVGGAIDVVNHQLGTHLALTGDLLAADIVIDWHAAYEIGEHLEESPLNDASGYCEHIRLPSGRLTANMVVRTQGTVELEHKVTVHELGHCLGLAHSGFGIMRRQVANDGDPFVMFSDSQRDMIKELYPE